MKKKQILIAYSLVGIVAATVSAIHGVNRKKRNIGRCSYEIQDEMEEEKNPENANR